MEQTKKCTACGYDAKADAKFCLRCGKPFAATGKRCPICGREQDSNTSFCWNCGAQLGVQPQAQPKPQPHSAPLKKEAPRKKKKGPGCLGWILIFAAIFILGVIFQEMDVDTGSGPDLSSTQHSTTSAPPPSSGLEVQPTLTQPDNGVPTDLADSYYLEAMGDGYCEQLSGDVVVLVIFVSTPSSSWDDAGIAEAKTAFHKELERLEQDAQGYGIELNLQIGCVGATITTEYDRQSETWREEAMTQAGMLAGYEDQRVLEDTYEVDHVPVVFVINQEGRAYANHSLSGNAFESLVMFTNYYEALRHELCHLFGAKDLYFPEETVQAADTYLPGSIMNGDNTGNIDPLTAFTIGWEEKLPEAAENFLLAVDSLTREYISESQKENQLTGYGTQTYDNGSYTGDLDFGMRHGQGTYYWNDGSSFTGTWVYGERTGYGEMTYSDGAKYAGNWLDGVRSGYGEITYAGGDVYKGYWANNECHGQGTYYWSTGGSYRGDWVNGVRQGSGTCIYADGAKYVGAWVNGVRSGYGELTSADGSTYKGYWADDKRSGNGTCVYADGAQYTGNWKDSAKNGYGVMYWANGNRYEGDFLNGQLHGTGTFTFAGGDKYVGDWKNGERTGYGVYYWTNGDRYEGYFLNGARHGTGTYYFADGTCLSGTWENGSYIG